MTHHTARKACRRSWPARFGRTESKRQPQVDALKTVGWMHGALKKSLTEQIPDFQDGDSPEVVNQKIDSYFDSLRTDLAKQKIGWFLSELTPEAQVQLKGLDARPSAMKANAQQVFAPVGQRNQIGKAQSAISVQRAEIITTAQGLAPISDMDTSAFAGGAHAPGGHINQQCAEAT